ncbi:MAG: hypothetical protein CENE_01204 [Candidatus Celerinatantimonas neptuna]|nr:MAG: hypothetical protein CENE_01204 [Candidatus Celerinatantimonas neptuna]
MNQKDYLGYAPTRGALRYIAFTCWLLASVIFYYVQCQQSWDDTVIRQKLVRLSQQFVYQLSPLSNSLYQAATAVKNTHSLNVLSHRVSRILATPDLGHQGFGFVVSDSGVLLSYPNSALIGKNIYQFAVKDSLAKVIANHLQLGELSAFYHPVSGQEYWMVLKSLPGADSQLGIVIAANELRHAPNKQYWILLIWFFVIFAIVFSTMKYRLPVNPIPRQNRCLVALVICLMGCLILVWHSSSLEEFHEQLSTQLLDVENTEIARLHQGHEGRGLSLVPHASKHKLYVAIESLDFVDANEVTLIGILGLDGWSQTGQPPVYIPDALKIAWQTISLQSDRQLWRFVVTLKQPFNYDFYPFDHEVITLTFVPIGGLAWQLLIPDFRDYNSMNPAELPGIIEKQHDFSGWQMQRSYFSYVPDRYTPGQLNLRYHLSIRRMLVGPLITHVMPLAVVSFLIYCMLQLWTKDQIKQRMWGFTTTGILQYSASMFFILVIAHVSLRDELDARGMIFIEYFYFLAYIQIILVAISGLFYTTREHLPGLDYHQGLLIKQWYWPVFLTLALLMSLVGLAR